MSKQGSNTAEKVRIRDFKLAASRAGLASDTTRLQIMQILVDNGQSPVIRLTKELKMSQPAISHHVALLRNSKLIELRREGKFNYYSLTDSGRKVHAAAVAVSL